MEIGEDEYMYTCKIDLTHSVRATSTSRLITWPAWSQVTFVVCLMHSNGVVWIYAHHRHVPIGESVTDKRIITITHLVGRQTVSNHEGGVERRTEWIVRWRGSMWLWLCLLRWVSERHVLYSL